MLVDRIAYKILDIDTSFSQCRYIRISNTFKTGHLDLLFTDLFIEYPCGWDFLRNTSHRHLISSVYVYYVHILDKFQTGGP